MILDKINKTGDIKKIHKSDYPILAQEIRDFLVDKTSKTGGHLAANLGVVELTMALHIALNLPEDKIVWDVGHQCYTHKLLTGRKAGFDKLRQYGGMSGFPKRHESASDAFDTGHSSTSISAALGLAVARDLSGLKNTVVAVIGDGALSGGMAYEALNNASERKTNFIIILNDNNLSISPSVGGMSRSLTKLRTSVKYNEIKNNVASGINSIPMVGSGLYNTISKTKSTIKQVALKKNGMLFEDMGLTYLGPYDGHDVASLVDVINNAKNVKGPVLIHVLTKKGKGYTHAENDPSRFHGIGKFDIDTGEAISSDNKKDYTKVFGDKLLELAEKNEKIVAITAAMSGGTGLTAFSKKYPKRFFDVGIAEEHAVTFAAGIAANGYRPVVAIYSSFLQRAYDQIIHDVCLQDLPVVFAIDRSGLTGPDGETHHGIFDISFLSSVPNLTVLAPKNGWELETMLTFALSYDHPVAIRYPKGCAYEGLKEYKAPVFAGKAEEIFTGTEVCLMAVGSMVKVAEKVCEQLEAEGISAGLYNMRFISPMDKELIIKSANDYKVIITLEENTELGGFGQHVSALLDQAKHSCKVINISIAEGYVCQGTAEELRTLCGLDAENITNRIIKELSYES